MSPTLLRVLCRRPAQVAVCVLLGSLFLNGCSRPPVRTTAPAVFDLSGPDIDLDNDGIRDDVEQEIHELTYGIGRYSRYETQKSRAAETFAQGLQRVLTSARPTPEVARRQLQRNAQAAFCLNLETLGPHQGELVRTITAKTFNTKARKAKAAAYAALAGTELLPHIDPAPCPDRRSE